MDRMDLSDLNEAALMEGIDGEVCRCFLVTDDLVVGRE